MVGFLLERHLSQKNIGNFSNKKSFRSFAPGCKKTKKTN